MSNINANTIAESSTSDPAPIASSDVRLRRAVLGREVRRCASALALLVLAALWAGSAVAQEARPSTSSQPSSQPSTRPSGQPNAALRPWPDGRSSEISEARSEPHSEWSSRLEEARARVVSAQSHVDSSSARYTRARTRRYPRGEGLQALRDDQNLAKTELREAVSSFSLLVERARRDGVPTGILSDYFDFEDEIEARREEIGADEYDEDDEF